MKKFFLFLFYFFLSFSFVKAEKVENVFNDIDKNYIYYHELQTLYDRGIIFPDEKGNFNPKQNLTRDEFVGIVSEISCKDCIKPNVDFDLVKKYSGQDIFFDISDTDKYFYCIADATKTGRVTGYQEGTSCQNGVSRPGEKPFCPTNNILLEEALAIVLRAGNILSISEAENLRNEIRRGKNFENILNISPKLQNGDIYSFYPDFKKAYEYTFFDYDKDGNQKKLKLLDFSKNINPKQFVTREDFLKISYIALKNNSCQNFKINDFGAKIEIFEKTCSENNQNCKEAEFRDGEKIFDFRGKISKFDDKNFVYNWRFYEYSTGKEVLKNGKFIDNYNFLKDGKYRVFLTVTSPKGENSEVFSDVKIGLNEEKNEEKDFGLKLEILDKNCNPGFGTCKKADLDSFEKIFDLKGINSLVDDEKISYSWKIYDYSNGKEKIKYGKYLDNYDFEKDGKYRITFSGVSENGKKSEVHAEINIKHKITDNVSLKILVDKSIAKKGDSINFTGISNKTGGTYSWDFGDGKTGTGQNISHEFEKNGNYNVVLTFTDKDGNISKTNLIVSIGENISGITSLIISDKVGIKPGEKINFTGISNKTDVSYAWDFGDGKKINGKNVENPFIKSGIYNVKLTVYDKQGQKSTSSINIFVGDESSNNLNNSNNDNKNNGLTSFILVDKIVSKPGEPVKFTGVSNKGSHAKYSWDFGDGKTGTGENILHNFLINGVYTVRLIVTDENGNISESIINIKITNAGFDGDGIDTDKDGVPDENDYEKNTPPDKIKYICTVEFIEKKLFGCEETDLGVYKQIIENNFREREDSDGDGLSNSEDRCPDLKGEKSNFGCPIFEKTCKVDSDCGDGYFCENGYCKVEKYLPSCNYSGKHIITGNLECNSCPCEYELDFNAKIRACDIVFPAITSPDQKEIYGKGKYFQIKK